MSDYQSDFTNDLSMPAYGQAPRKGWFGRNWLWFVPTIILLPIFCCCGGGGALIWFGIGKVLELPPYKDSVALAEQDAAVQSALGTPIDSPEDFMDLVSMMQGGGQFDFKQTNSQVQFDVTAPLSGPNGTGKLVVQAESADGGVTWNYTIQEVQLPDGTVIDLLPAGSGSNSGEAVEDAPEEESPREIPDQE